MIVLVAFLSFLVVLTSSANVCPPDVLIRPCRCGGNGLVICSNFTDVGALQDVFENSGEWPFNEFILEHSNIMYIPASAVEKKQIKNLFVRKSTLVSLFDAAPNVENRLRRIELYSVTFQRGIRWELMKNLKQILFMEFESSEFRRLGKDFADNVGPSLYQFLMEDTKTTSLDDRVFSRLNKLVNVHFRNSRISTLKRSMFPNPSKLTLFDFRRNEIETLPDDMFQGMPNLWTIQLQGNRIKYFSEAVFGGVVESGKISTLNLENNPIICDCSIRWFLRDMYYFHFEAKCAGPEDKKGKHVEVLDRKDFDYCPRSNGILDVVE